MSGKLDEISTAIGELREGMRQSASDRAALHADVREANRKLDVLPALADDVREMKPHVEDYKRLKNRGLGLLLGAGLAGGGVWEACKALWSWLAKGSG